MGPMLKKPRMAYLVLFSLGISLLDIYLIDIYPEDMNLSSFFQETRKLREWTEGFERLIKEVEYFFR